MKFPPIFDGNYLFTVPNQEPTIFFGILTAGFVVLLALSAFAFWRRSKLAPNNPVMRRYLRRAARAGMWSAGIGLVIALLRYVQFPYLGAPIFMYLLLLAMVGVTAYFVYDLSERYPMAVWQLQQNHVQRQYTPAARKGAAARPVRPRPQVRGKQRKR